MRTFLALILVAMTIGITSGQIYDPVKWSSSFEHLGGDDFVLIHKATIEDGWSVYSQFLESDEGPVATTLNHDAGTHYELVGEAEESGDKKEGFDEIFEMNVTKFFHTVTLRQQIKLLEAGNISGYINFMCCDDTKCLPPSDYEFTLTPLAQVISDPDGSEPTAGSSETFGTVDETIAPQATQSTIFNPVKWTYTIDVATKKATAIGVIEDGWHIYSSTVGPDDGPIATEVILGGESMAITEKADEMVSGFDEVFEVELTKLKKRVELTFDVPEGQDPIEGEVIYMACESTRCILPEPGRFTLDPLAGTIGFEGVGVEISDQGDLASATGLFPLDLTKMDEPLGVCDGVESRTEVGGGGLWSIFSLGFIGGLLALLTPCVFPMIPLTVSFFTKGSENKSKGIARAVTYGFFILLIYVLLSIPFHLMDSINPDILNEISTNVVLNLAFFAIFLFFAFSFFGFYEITIPSSWSNRASSAEGVGGLVGIFFMALTLALVSFSCTGPILGTLLAGALTSDGGAMQLSAGMGGFGLALALPFALFAAFPGLMGSIPKSGGWLNTVKVVLGFLELGLAFKFLSNADLVKRWGLLKIEPFLIIEIIVFIGLALYLFGKIKFPHDSPLKKVGFGRLSLGIISLVFAGYLASGFQVNTQTNTFQSLKLLSGLAPPVGYSWIYPNSCPNDLDCFKDLDEGLAYAKEVNKPIMIDFTGHACVNCRKMEEHVWPQTQVINHLKNNYVLISLYVDEKIDLPEDQQVMVNKSAGGTRKLRTVGNKWQHFQTEYFGNNSQPLYVLLSPDGELLNKPVGYMPDAEEYAAFLDCGLGNYQASIGSGVLGVN